MSPVKTPRPDRTALLSVTWIAFTVNVLPLGICSFRTMRTPSTLSRMVLAAGLATTEGLPTAPPTATLVNVELPVKTTLPALQEAVADEATACAVKLSRLPSAALKFWTLPALCTALAPSALLVVALRVPLPTETAPERMLPRILTEVPVTLKSGGAAPETPLGDGPSERVASGLPVTSATAAILT